MNNFRSILFAVLVVLLLFPGLAFMFLRLALPTDASLPIVDFDVNNPAGVVVRPASPNPAGLQNGDIVTAIQGRRIDEYITALFPLSFSELQSNKLSSQIEYTVLRGGSELKIAVPLQPFPLAKTIKENWSIYIYIIYLMAVSLLVFLLRPQLPAAQLFFVASTILSSSALVYFPGLEVDDLLVPWLVILYLCGAVFLFGLMQATIVHSALIFPRRHPALDRIPGWKLFIYLGIWVPLAIYLVFRWGAVSSPLGRLALLIQGTTLMSAVYFPLLLLVSYSSYQVRNAQEKRQMRWIVWSLMIAIGPYIIFSVLPSLLGLPFQVPASVWGVLWCIIPTSFAIAVLRERLFDIDVIIRRTLIYSALTVALGGVYFVSVLLLQEFFQVLTGQHQSPLATVLSTLVIAALFTPMRRNIQAAIDRRFYRRKYDTEKMLRTFSLTVRNEVDLDQLSERLVNVVDETLEPQNLSLWIRNPDA